MVAPHRIGITHHHEEHDPLWTGAWTGRREFPALLVLSVRSGVSSVQLTRPSHRSVLMVRRRSTVRFR